MSNARAFASRAALATTLSTVGCGASVTSSTSDASPSAVAAAAAAAAPANPAPPRCFCFFPPFSGTCSAVRRLKAVPAGTRAHEPGERSYPPSGAAATGRAHDSASSSHALS